MSTNVNHVFTFQHPVELLFANLFEQKTPKGIEAAKPRWDITVFFAKDHPDYQAMKKAFVSAAKSKFGEDIKNLQIEWPIETGESFISRVREKKGDKAPDNSYLEGKVILSAKSYRYPPQLSVLVPGRGVVTYEGENRNTVRDKFYPGCQVRLEVNFVPWKMEGRQPRYGVTAYVNAVLSLNKGERRGGQRSGADRFGTYEHEGTVSEVNPMVDDVPF